MLEPLLQSSAEIDKTSLWPLRTRCGLPQIHSSWVFAEEIRLASRWRADEERGMQNNGNTVPTSLAGTCLVKQRMLQATRILTAAVPMIHFGEESVTTALYF